MAYMRYTTFTYLGVTANQKHQIYGSVLPVDPYINQIFATVFLISNIQIKSKIY